MAELMHRDEIVAVKNLGQVNFLAREQEFLCFIGASDS